MERRGMNGSVGDKKFSGVVNKEHFVSFTLVVCCALGSPLAAVAVAAVAAATGSGTSPLRLARISATLRFSTVLGVPGVPGVEAPPVVTIRPPGLPPPAAAAASATLLLMAAAAFSPLTRVTICDPSPWLSRFLRNKNIWEP